MPAASNAIFAVGDRVHLRRPRFSDSASFVAAVRASRSLHADWVQAPKSPTRFAAYVRRFAGPKSKALASATHVGLLVCRIEDDAPVGVFNLSEIVREKVRDDAGDFTADRKEIYCLMWEAGVQPTILEYRIRPLAPR